jgi:cell division inhibitor SulA
MMVNLLDDSNFHRQTAVMNRLIEMIIQNPVFGISCIISMLVHSTSQCLMSLILLLPLFTITMPNVTAGGIFFPEVIATW